MEKLVHPDINPLIVLMPTVIMVAFTLVVFVIRPPARVKRKFR